MRRYLCSVVAHLASSWQLESITNYWWSCNRVSLDYLTGAAPEATRDQRMLDRIDAIAKLSAERQATLLDVLDAYVRDARTAKAYAA